LSKLSVQVNKFEEIVKSVTQSTTCEKKNIAQDKTKVVIVKATTSSTNVKAKLFFFIISYYFLDLDYLT
jgi:hypothetical protein